MHSSFVSYKRIFDRICRWTLKDSFCFKYLCMHKYSSLTWCAVSSGSSHSHPLFSSLEFLSDPSSQDRSQTGDTNAISQIGRDPRLFCDFFEKWRFRNLALCLSYLHNALCKNCLFLCFGCCQLLFTSSIVLFVS